MEPTASSDVPVSVGGMQAHVTSISPNQFFTCGVQSGGAKCWGYNYYGELGDGSRTNRDHPTQVVGLTSGVVKISADSYSACAVLTTEEATCWGDNSAGDLGNDATTQSDIPVKVLLI